MTIIIEMRLVLAVLAVTEDLVQRQVRMMEPVLVSVSCTFCVLWQTYEGLTYLCVLCVLCVVGLFVCAFMCMFRAYLQLDFGSVIQGVSRELTQCMFALGACVHAHRR
jgi:hypothetical protein